MSAKAEDFVALMVPARHRRSKGATLSGWTESVATIDRAVERLVEMAVLESVDRAGEEAFALAPITAALVKAHPDWSAARVLAEMTGKPEVEAEGWWVA